MRKVFCLLAAGSLMVPTFGCGEGDKPTTVAPVPSPNSTPSPDSTPTTPSEPTAYVVPPTVTPMNPSPIDTAPPPIIPVSLDTPAGPIPPAPDLPTIPVPALPPLPPMK